MQFITCDNVHTMPSGQTPDYNDGNSLMKLLAQTEQVSLACERGTYIANQLQYLFPVHCLDLYGPSGDDHLITDPRVQDNKFDFQKQNIRDFTLSNTNLVRGWAVVQGITVPFLRISYDADSTNLQLKSNGEAAYDHILAWIKIGETQTESLIQMPYNPNSDRYEVELWGYTEGNLRDALDAKGKDAIERGELQVRSDLIKGTREAFARDNYNDHDMRLILPDCTMHPILPLRVEVAWRLPNDDIWDSNDGQNYRYEFSMILRGLDNYLAVGTSDSPHGGVGQLEYRNLLSNYGRFGGTRELGRPLNPWNFNAQGNKDHARCVCGEHHDQPYENAMAVDYMDLHIMKENCGIGLHRHRDNSEVFLMMEGEGYMVVGDWLKHDHRERCFEIRTLRAGHFAMLRGSQCHGLFNPTDQNISLFMFGGYD